MPPDPPVTIAVRLLELTCSFEVIVNILSVRFCAAASESLGKNCLIQHSSTSAKFVLSLTVVTNLERPL